MRLLRPSPGEAADRQTILLLKAQYGNVSKINIKHFTDEQNEIQDYLAREYFSHIGTTTGELYNQLFIKLKEVNATLWRLEDEIRIQMKLVPQNKERLAELGPLICDHNDQRMRLVQEINKLFGITQQEKVYVA
jgi:hypothetical protein